MYLDDVQVKLIILYTLRCFKISMTEANLQEILVWPGILDYFTMMNQVFDLEDMNLVKDLMIEDKKRYDITEKGKEYINMFKDKIPLSIRDDIYDASYNALSKIAKGREIVADIVPIDDRKFMARCGIYEFNVPLIEVNLYAGSRKQAEEIAKRFEKEASKVYKIILDHVIEGK